MRLSGRRERGTEGAGEDKRVGEYKNKTAGEPRVGEFCSLNRAMPLALAKRYAIAS